MSLWAFNDVFPLAIGHQLKQAYLLSRTIIRTFISVANFCNLRGVDNFALFLNQ